MDDIEDAVVFEVGEGGGKALFFVEGVLVDAEKGWATEADALGGLSAGKLLIDAQDGGGADALGSGQRGCGNAVVVLVIDPLPERFGGSAPWQQPRQGLNEGALAVLTPVTAAMDDQRAGLIKTIEVPGFALVEAFAAQATPSAAWAGNSGAPSRSQMDDQLVLVLA